MPSNFELNKGDQFIVAFDCSGSMQTPDCPGGTTRFTHVKETMKAFIRAAAQWDPDGVSFYAFNFECREYPDVKTPEEIETIIAALRPSGGTNTHLAIRDAYAEHKRKGSEQTFLLIFTDGEPTEPDLVEAEVVRITNDVQDEKEFRISILTVGKRSAGLEAWLSDLDNNLTSARYDIIDVNELDKVDFMAAVDGAITG